MPIARRQFLKRAGCSAGSLALCGCVQNNVATGRSSYTGGTSAADDVRIGANEHPKLLEAFGGEYQDRRLTGYVERLGLALARHTEYQYPYRFTVLNSPIVNAFALPGGYVYVSRGLVAITGSEAELAGVIAHELGHVTARHSAERQGTAQLAGIGVLLGALGAQALGLPGSDIARIGQTVAGLAISGYSREQESEADVLGIRYMVRAGYDPEAMVSFLATLREQSALEAQMAGRPADSVDQFNMAATHPRTIDRVRAAQQLAQVQRPPNPRLGREELLAAIDGMLFGDDPAQGIVKGTRFLHPVLRFEFTVPEGFRISNSPQRVTASSPRGAGIVFDLASTQRTARMVDYVQQEWAPRTALRDVEVLNVNGIEAGTGWTTVNGRSGPVDVRLLAYRRDPRSVYRMMFVSPQSQTGALATAFRSTAFSFRYLSPTQAAQVNPMRLLVVNPVPGDTVASLSRTLPFDRFNEAFFRMLNDLDPGQRLPASGQIKVVAA